MPGGPGASERTTLDRTLETLDRTLETLDQTLETLDRTVETLDRMAEKWGGENVPRWQYSLRVKTPYWNKAAGRLLGL